MTGSSGVDVRLGFLPLVDCAPLVVAREKRLFAAEGLNVELSRQASWANVRDKVQMGLLDGAHMLGPMPLAASLGAGSERSAMIAPLALNANGSAITVSTALAAEMRRLDPEGMVPEPRAARPLARVVEARRAAGERPLVFAVVFPFSMHNYELRYWMAAAGVAPDRDVLIVVVPPPRMSASLKSGEIDGFCVGAPWTAVSVAEGAGEVMIRADQFWAGGPDKVFGVAELWAEHHPDTLQAVLRALLRAAAWCDDPANRRELAALLARPACVGEPESLLRAVLEGAGAVVFQRGGAGAPRRSHAAWFLSQMIRWGQVGADIDPAEVARRVYRPDLYAVAALETGAPGPMPDHGAATLFDGLAFDPAEPLAYARSFAIRR